MAEKSGLLRVIDRFALERAIRVIRSGIHENSPPKVLLNQVTLAYTDRESRAKKLEIIKQLNLPKDSLYVQFHLQYVVDNFEHIGEIGQQRACKQFCVSALINNHLSDFQILSQNDSKQASSCEWA